MAITFELTRFDVTWGGEMPRPLIGTVEGVFTVEGRAVTCPWHVAMDELTRMFPNVEFVTAWVGHVCTFVAVRRRRIVIDPVCPIFATEVGA
jgi:hypothetical protein